jgi:glycosyltransferase involved in cell wall biosynthesis
VKILFTIHGFPPHELGGSEIYSFSIARALRRRGIDVVVFARAVDFDKSPYSLMEEEVDGIRVVRIVNNLTDFQTFSDYFINRKIRDSFISLLFEEKPDVVHFQHLFALSGDLPSVAKFYGVPNIMMLHDYWYLCLRVNLFRPDHSRCTGPHDGSNCLVCSDNGTPDLCDIPRFTTINKIYSMGKLRLFLKRIIPQRHKAVLKSLIFRKRIPAVAEDSIYSKNGSQDVSFRTDFFRKQLSACNYIISPSRYLQNRYMEQGFKNVTYIPLGIDPMPEVSKKPLNGLIRLGFVGNITATKGFAVLLSELQRIKNLEKIEVHIFGQIYEEEYFRREFSHVTSRLLDRIKFHGRFERDPRSLKKVYENMDVLIFPSICEENSPLVVREALMTGTPVIASNIGGIPEIVVNENNGLLFDPDHSGDLAERIDKLIRDPQLIGRLWDGAKATKVKDINEHSQQIIDLYSILLSANVGK